MTTSTEQLESISGTAETTTTELVLKTNTPPNSLIG
jgi:hypothetical protein